MANALTSSSLAGKTVVVTGASDGIGKAAVRAYVSAGASVVMIGRNEAKTAAAAHSILSDVGATSRSDGSARAITWEIADLSRQEEVHDVADRLLARLPRIDVLANNAGAMFLDRDVTPDGFERTFALNHLSYVTLTLRLLAPLVAAARPGAPSRVLSVSSRAHENARPALDDLQLSAISADGHSTPIRSCTTSGSRGPSRVVSIRRAWWRRRCTRVWCARDSRPTTGGWGDYSDGSWTWCR
jgi:NAD(P)-dependent dehydrogenase (short-subunit alcohol dehydrogenase family)